MNIPKSYKISVENKGKALRWIEESGLIGEISYDWIKGVVTFHNDKDTLAFSLANRCERYITDVEEKIRNEESHN
jgi:hypothetical protein